MLKLLNLNKYYGKRKNKIHVINNTSLELPSKGLIALLGPSGCGKTTLLNVIGGLDKAKKGKIYIDDIRITPKSVYKVDKIRNLKIGYIFQDYKLVDTMTVYENVSLVLKMIGIKDKGEIKKRVDYILERVGMYRYRNRPCSMLSGGERQRVGIARALVKNPDIILADEPTGNLDSKNTIEIMNIIKSISKDKLIILVTHEVNIAKFYATRIIEITDGVISNDYENKEVGDLDYRLENKFYLKDFRHHDETLTDNIKIDMYSDNAEKLKLTVIFKNGNIYIKGKDKDRIEVIDDDSNIELVNDNYKKIDKSIYEEYNFDFDKIINKNIKLKYSSIFNIFSLIKYGFNKVFNYSFIKKLLLLGFFLSSMFTTYSICNAFGVLEIKDTEFVTTNKNYMILETNKIKYEDFLKYQNFDSINYIIPGSSRVSIPIDTDFFYQTRGSIGFYSLKGSLSSINMIKESDIIAGSFPENDDEIVIDKRLYDYISSIKMVGIYSANDLINVTVGGEGIKKYTIVGITDLSSPSIYVYEKEIMRLLREYPDNNNTIIENNYNNILDYNEYKNINNIKIVKGKEPVNDYEVIVDESLQYTFKLNKKIDELKINDQKLKVVGYYKSSSPDNGNYYVGGNTKNIELITSSKNLMIYAKDKDKAITDFKENKKYIKDVYTYDKEEYVNSIKESIKISLIVAGIMLVISLVEIILMVRSSFLSRIKEVGIFRAIGVKKSDIYKMFSSESFAISTIASMPGVLFMSYCLSKIKDINYFGNNYMVNTFTIIICLLVTYLFNIFAGLIPVINTVRHTPAEILSKQEVD